MIFSLLLIIGATLLSAFCSGVETGLYRVPRVRLVLDSLDGSRVARGIIWLTNYPGLYVSTLLLANNIANYILTVGIASFVVALIGYDDPWVNVIISFLSTPFLFVYCELLPKSLFHQAPHRLLKVFGWPLMILTVLLLPITWVMYLLSRSLEKILGEEPLKIRPALAKRELRQVLREGEEAGLLEPVQRDLAHNLFAYGGDSISQYCMPLRGLKSVPMDVTLAEAKQTAQRSSQTVLPVIHPRYKRLVGYLSVEELMIADEMPKLNAMSTFRQNTSHIEVLNQMVTKNCELGRVVNDAGELVGVVLRSRLVMQMLQRT